MAEHRRLRNVPSELFRTEENPPLTPPYRQEASSSQVVIMTSPHDDDDVERKGKEKPTGVHYPDDIGVGPLHALPSPSYPQPKPRRLVSDPPSRQPSLADSENEEDEDEYDWSDEDDLVDEEAKFEKKMGNKTKQTGWGIKRIMTLLFSTLIGSTFLAAALVAVPVLLRKYYLEPNRTERRQFVTDNVSAWIFWAAANLLLSWYLAVIIDIIPHIATFFVGIVWGHISESYKSKVALYQSVKPTFKVLLYAASAWASWAILFDNIYKLHNPDDEGNSRASYTPRAYQVVKFLFFLTLVLSVEKTAMQLIASSFHRVAFQERLEAVTKALKVLDHLKDYRPRTQHNRRSGIPSGMRTPPILSTYGTPANENAQFITSRQGTPEQMDDGFAADVEKGTTKGKAKSSSSGWFGALGSSSKKDTAPSPLPMHMNASHTYPPPSRPSSRPSSRAGSPQLRSNRTSVEEEATIVQAAKAIRTAVLHDARNIKGKDAEEENALGWNVTSGREAKKLARFLYFSFKADKRRRYLIPEDFYPAYTTHEEAEDAFRVFDKDNNGDITKPELKTTILKIYKERRFLSRSLRDVGAALKTLDWIMIVFAMVILFFISLSVFNVELGSSLSSVYSIAIAASFIFKNAASSAFDSIIFLFVSHPFDTGDRCFIEEENLVVKKMGLFATTFTRSDGTETYYFNSQLFTKFITNVRRSGKTAENLRMQCSWRTPLEKLDELEKCMNRWLQTDENRWFESSTSISLQNIEFQRSLELTIGIGHNGNWQDWGMRNARKTAFHAAAQFYCRQLGISYCLAPQPILFTDNKHFSSAPVEVDDAAAMSPIQPETPHPSSATEQKEQKPMLGFLPPPESRAGLRARKKTKKGGLRGNMGD